MADKKTSVKKASILKEAGRILDYRHVITASFLSENYQIDDDSFILFVLSLSILLDEGHIRIELESMKVELEKYFLLNVKTDSPIAELLVKNCSKSSSVIKKYPEVFKDSSSLFRAPFIVLDSGQTLTSEKLFTLERSTVTLLKNHFKNSWKSPVLADSFTEAEEIAVYVEKDNGITFEKKQRDAVEKSLLLPFLLLTGGPGTGKTTTVVSIVKALLEGGERKGTPVSIALCAPTGRAANRIEELVSGEGIENLIEKPQTLHRLLKISTGSSYYGNGRFLPYDAVIVDESSMIDLKMMKKLFEALAEDTTLIMAGDADQLPSVEAGAVFSDMLSGADKGGHILEKSVVVLDRMKRSVSELSEFAVSIKENNFSSDKIAGSTCITLKPLDENVLYRDLAALYSGGSNADSVFKIIEGNGILTATNKGPFGMDSINRKLKDLYRYSDVPFYENMPLMILKNDYVNKLFNGDRGVVVKKDDIFAAAFKSGEGIRYIPLSMLKEWGISYAQTVHKSQGSEFDNVYLVIDSFSKRILTKEILYTAVTRAKKKIIIYSDEDTLETAMSRIVYRNSGIKDAMRRGV